MPSLFQLTVKKRLLLIGCFVLVLVAMLIGSGWHALSLVQKKNQVARQLEQASALLQVVLRGVAEYSLTEGTPGPYKEAMGAVESFETSLARLREEIQAADVQDELAKIVPQWQDLRGEIDAFFEYEEISPFNIEAMVSYGRLTTKGGLLDKDLNRAVHLENAFVAQVVATSLRQFAFLAFVAVLVLTVLLLSLYSTVVRPISRMAVVARKVAEGDLTAEFSIHRHDEIGVLAHAFTDMTDRLKKLISGAKTMSGDISVLSESLSRYSSRVVSVSAIQKKAMEDTARTMTAMDGFVASMAASSSELLHSSETAASAVSSMTESISRVALEAKTHNEIQDGAVSAVNQMVASIDEVDRSIQSLSASSEEIVVSLSGVDRGIQSIQVKASESVLLAERVSREASEKGMPAVQSAVGGMQEIKRSVSSLAEVIHGLRKRSEEIGKILAVIDEVADQTQLLSLNAAIIAAQAGEHGHAFAVVASEIKSLAQKTTVSTREVSELITAIQHETHSSVTQVHEGLEVVDRGVELVRGASLAFEKINSSSYESTEMSRAIEHTTLQQAEDMGRVLTEIREISGYIDRISSSTGEQTRANRTILETLEDTRTVARLILDATGQQITTSQLISQVSGEVSLQAQGIKDDIERHKRRSTEVVESMASINRTLTELVGSADDMDRSIDKLKRGSATLEEELKHFVV